MTIGERQDSARAFKSVDCNAPRLHEGPVVCAGMMKAEQGRLKYIDNDSGHYKPPADSLKTALACMRDEYGVDLAGVRVHYKDARGDWAPAVDGAIFAK